MKIEFEAKFYPVNKEQMRITLKKAGAKLIQPEKLMPLVEFTNFANEFKFIHYLRVRDEFGKVKLAAKRHATKSDGIDKQKELEVEVSDFHKIIDILKIAGLNADFYQEKYREIWTLNEAEIVIDTCPGLKPYVEIEAADEDTVKSVANLLNFNWADAIFTSTIEIYMKEHNVSKEETLKRFRDWRF